MKISIYCSGSVTTSAILRNEDGGDNVATSTSLTSFNGGFLDFEITQSARYTLVLDGADQSEFQNRFIATSDGSDFSAITDGVVKCVSGKFTVVAKNTAHNVNFGSNVGNIPAIGTNLEASKIVETDANKKLITATKNSAYNKNFGTGTDNVPQIGATLSGDKIVETDSDGKLTTVSKGTAYNKNFGTTSGSVAEGDHTHTLTTSRVAGTEGGAIVQKSTYGTISSMSGTSVEVTLGDISVNDRIIAVQVRVNSTIVISGTSTQFKTTIVDGPTDKQTIIKGQNLVLNTKKNSFYDANSDSPIIDNSAKIKFEPYVGSDSFTAGGLTYIVYYETFEDMANYGA